MDLKGDLVLLELVNGLLYNGQIAVTAHDNSNFFHMNLLKKRKGLTHPPEKERKQAQTVGKKIFPYSMWCST